MQPCKRSHPTIVIYGAYVLASGLGSGLAPAPVLAEGVTIPGTSVSLEAPAGFVVSADFSGLRNPRDSSTVVVTELPKAACSELLPVFTDLDLAISSFQPRGVSIERATTYRVGQKSIPALIGSQEGPDGDVRKYLALYCGDVVVLLTVNAFDPRVLTPAVVADTIQSLRLAPAVTLQQKLDELPFSFSVAAPFRVADAVGGSSAMVPSFEGADPTGLKPLIIIVRALSAIDPSSDVESVAQQLLSTTQGFESAEIRRLEKVDFGGGTGAFLAAVAGERTVVQYLRIPADGMYIRLLALGGTADLEPVMQAVTDIAASVAISE